MPAGPGLRVLAFTVDLALQALLVVVIGLLLASAAAAWLFLLLLFAVWWGYPVAFELLNGGRTPGKLLAGIQVVREDGLPVTWRDSVLRNLLLSADFLPFLWLSALLCLFLDARFRRLGDLVAGTLVVHVPGKPRPGALLSPGPACAPPWPLQVEEQRLLIDLAERLPQLSGERAAELGALAAELVAGEEPLEALLAWARELSR